ncbi:hypothetical protein STCU_11335 [Strigomonas culicis]|uniref:Ama1 protein n=1 Tax=Strigomonas culicis TaxID=28005 RepID=S9UNW5_9TRYP|nr:hypothetical protein STCU_11335 [Strigomonas culicis]|eukprot:EPY16381.1 hypothetical protein STCU_11335 [Strigomonas culicis]
MTENHEPTTNYVAPTKDTKPHAPPPRRESGGCSQCCGCDQCDWGGDAAECYACWKLNPCCGTPDPCKMLSCFLCWECCYLCSFSKLFASSVEQECAIFPHCILVALCQPYVRLCVRNNLRRRLGVQGSMMGDAVCCCCCWVCSFCQELRAVPREAWNLIEPSWRTPECMAPELVFLK